MAEDAMSPDFSGFSFADISGVRHRSSGIVSGQSGTTSVVFYANGEESTEPYQRTSENIASASMGSFMANNALEDKSSDSEGKVPGAIPPLFPKVLADAGLLFTPGVITEIVSGGGSGGGSATLPGTVDPTPEPGPIATLLVMAGSFPVLMLRRNMRRAHHRAAPRH